MLCSRYSKRINLNTRNMLCWLLVIHQGGPLSVYIYVPIAYKGLKVPFNPLVERQKTQTRIQHQSYHLSLLSLSPLFTYVPTNMLGLKCDSLIKYVFIRSLRLIYSDTKLRTLYGSMKIHIRLLTLFNKLERCKFK